MNVAAYFCTYIPITPSDLIAIIELFKYRRSFVDRPTETALGLNKKTPFVLQASGTKAMFELRSKRITTPVVVGIKRGTE